MFFLGRKKEMSQIFEGDKVIPVTIIQAGPCWVTQIKLQDKDGYKAIQVGFEEEVKEHRINKAQKGHLKKSGKNLKILREFRVDNPEEYKSGQELNLDDLFKKNDIVKISGFSKAKGFQGVVKRHHFKGAPASHGTKHNKRAPGSIGSSFPERVFKGKKMAGRTGGERVTVRNLKIADVDKNKNLILVKGAVPGRKGTLLEIKKI